jgi:hypothetical protein
MKMLARQRCKPTFRGALGDDLAIAAEPNPSEVVSALG